MSDSMVVVGKIIGPHGIKGNVKFLSYTTEPCDVFNYKTFFDSEGCRYLLKKVSYTNKNDVFIVSIDGVNDRNVSETLRGIELLVERSEIADSDEILLNELVGFNVSDSLGIIGKVVDILNYGAGDILELEILGKVKTSLISYNENSVLNIDKDNKIILIDREHLIEN